MKIKNQRQSKNVRDISSSKEAARHATKAKLDAATRARLREDREADYTTDTLNAMNSLRPQKARIPRLKDNHPATKPTSFGTNEGFRGKALPVGTRVLKYKTETPAVKGGPPDTTKYQKELGKVFKSSTLSTDKKKRAKK